MLWFIHTVEYHSALKRHEIHLYVQTARDLYDIISEKNAEFRYTQFNLSKTMCTCAHIYLPIYERGAVKCSTLGSGVTPVPGSGVRRRPGSCFTRHSRNA